MRLATIRRRVIRPLLVALLLPGGFVGWRWAVSNGGTVVPGQIYRSGQCNADQLTSWIKGWGIRTVLNLRGANPEQPWYRAERAATLAAGAMQVDVALATDQWLARDQLRMLLELLRTCPRPLLIHCEWGAERTGLVSSLASLCEPGGTLAQAAGQFSLYYLFLPNQEGRIMKGHLDLYRAWLRETGRAHSPEVFMHWATSVYRPGSPSREEWPYDPYPLAVISRPDHPTAVGTGRPDLADAQPREGPSAR